MHRIDIIIVYKAPRSILKYIPFSYVHTSPLSTATVKNSGSYPDNPAYMYHLPWLGMISGTYKGNQAFKQKQGVDSVIGELFAV